MPSQPIFLLPLFPPFRTAYPHTFTSSVTSSYYSRSPSPAPIIAQIPSNPWSLLGNSTECLSESGRERHPGVFISSISPLKTLSSIYSRQGSQSFSSSYLDTTMSGTYIAPYSLWLLLLISHILTIYGYYSLSLTFLSSIARLLAIFQAPLPLYTISVRLLTINVPWYLQ